MNSTERKEQLKLIERLLVQGSDRVTLVSGAAPTGVASKNPVWKRFQRVKLDGKVCQVIRCGDCSTVMPHRTGTVYDKSVGQSSGTATLARHTCPKSPQAMQPPITAVLKRTIPEGAKRAEKRSVAEALGDMCVEDLRPFSLVEGEQYTFVSVFCECMERCCVAMTDLDQNENAQLLTYIVLYGGI